MQELMLGSRFGVSQMDTDLLQPCTWEEEDEEDWFCDEEGCDCCEEDVASLDDWKSFEHKADPLQYNGTANLHSDTTVGDLLRYPTNQPTRTLYHPTFEAYYAAVAMLKKSGDTGARKIREGGFNINNGDYYYTDPLLSAGHRVYNCLSTATQNVFRCFHLNTPPPIMSPCVYTSSSSQPGSSSLSMSQNDTVLSAHRETSPQSRLFNDDGNLLKAMCEEPAIRTNYSDIPCPLVTEESDDLALYTYQTCSDIFCTPAEADAVYALLSLAWSNHLPAGQ